MAKKRKAVGNGQAIVDFDQSSRYYYWYCCNNCNWALDWVVVYSAVVEVEQRVNPNHYHHHQILSDIQTW